MASKAITSASTMAHAIRVSVPFVQLKAALEPGVSVTLFTTAWFSVRPTAH